MDKNSLIKWCESDKYINSLCKDKKYFKKLFHYELLNNFEKDIKIIQGFDKLSKFQREYIEEHGESLNTIVEGLYFEKFDNTRPVIKISRIENTNPVEFYDQYNNKYNTRTRKFDSTQLIYSKDEQLDPSVISPDRIFIEAFGMIRFYEGMYILITIDEDIPYTLVYQVKDILDNNSLVILEKQLFKKEYLVEDWKLYFENNTR